MHPSNPQHTWATVPGKGKDGTETEKPFCVGAADAESAGRLRWPSCPRVPGLDAEPCLVLLEGELRAPSCAQGGGS